MKDSTHIAVLLDRSGSMMSVKDETISGYNVFLKEQQKQGDNANLTLVQFDSSSIDTLEENVTIKSAKELNADTFQPRGMTPLLDALGQTIEATGKVLSAIPENNRPDKVVFVIITDGFENASRKFSRQRIKEMIEHQSSAYKWNFIYLGANQDAFTEAGSIGIAPGTTATYDQHNTVAAFTTTSANIGATRSSGDVNLLKYSHLQRKTLIKK